MNKLKVSYTRHSQGQTICIRMASFIETLNQRIYYFTTVRLKQLTLGFLKTSSHNHLILTMYRQDGIELQKYSCILLPIMHQLIYSLWDVQLLSYSQDNRCSLEEMKMISCIDYVLFQESLQHLGNKDITWRLTQVLYSLTSNNATYQRQYLELGLKLLI